MQSSRSMYLNFFKMVVALLFLVVPFVPFAHAENRSEQHLYVELGPHEASATIGLIHGWGFLSYENLTFTRSIKEDEEDQDESQTDIDIVVSTLPEYDGKKWTNYQYIGGEPENDREFWHTLGIGNFHENSGFHICCTEDAFQMGVCDDYGRLIVSDTSEEKVITQAKIREGNTTNDPLSEWRSSAHFDYTTPVVLIIANCGANADETLVEGQLIWMSYTSLSAIPVKLVLAIAHLVLFLWYRYQMFLNRPTRIQVEVWINGVLALAAVSTATVFAYTSLETILSREVLWLRVLSDFAAKTTQVVSRCLYVAIALGLGVTKVQLSVLTQSAIVILGLAVLFSKETADVMGDIAFAKRDNNFGDDFNQERHEFLKLQFELNMLFEVWIPLALLWTMHEMRKMNVEPQKLQRHKWLFRLYFLSWLVTSGMVGSYLLMRYILRTGHGSLLSSIFRSNGVDRAVINEIHNVAYWITLVCMAILWKPSPEAPMYGYVALTDSWDQEGVGQMEGHKIVGSNTPNTTMELAGLSPPSSTDNAEEVQYDLSLHVETVDSS